MTRHGYLLLCLVLLPVVLVFSFVDPWPVSDFWETAAAVRELSVRPFEPMHHLVRLPGETSLRFTPYTLLWGIVQRLTGLATLTTMGVAGVTNALIFFAGLYRLLAHHFASRSLPAYMLVVMLLVWGAGYGWANAYHLESFLLQLPYVGFFAFAVTLHALHHLDQFLSGRRRSNVVAYGTLSALVFLTHPITGAFCFIGAIAMLLEAGGLTRLLRFQSVPLIALTASLLWPYFDYREVFFRGVTESWFKSALFSQWVYRLGMALVGFPVALYFAAHQKHRFVVYGLGLCTVVYVVSGLTGTLIGARFLLYGAFFLHLALAVFLMEARAFSLRGLRDSWRGNALVALLVFSLFVPALKERLDEVRQHLGRVVDRPLRIHRYESPVDPFRFLTEELTEEDTVIADAAERYFVTALTGARVVSPATSLLVPDAERRREDVSGFFDERTGNEARRRLIQRYGVTHVLRVNEPEEGSPLAEALDAICPPTRRNGTVVLRRCSPPRSAADYPAGPIPAAVTPVFKARNEAAGSRRGSRGSDYGSAFRRTPA
jgi:hypothetical protein